MVPEDPAQALADIVLVLEDCAIRYFLVGSFASGIRGKFRATNGIDLVCQLGSEQIADFLNRAQGLFYCDEVAIPQAVQDKSSFNIIHEDSFVKVDIFTKVGSFESDQFDRASRLAIPGTEREVVVSSAEYNIVAKLLWYKKSDCVLERQLRDVEEMVRINQGELDMEYLTRWSEHFKVADLLSTIFNEP